MLARLALLVLATALPAAAATIPQPVSPGAKSPGAVTEARCPTFSWAGVPGARGYQLAIFRVPETPDEEPVLVTRASVPGDARAFTPRVDQCLERGERCAWSVAATANDSPVDHSLVRQLDWAPAFLFQVEAAPSPVELEQAMATIHDYLRAGAPTAPLSTATRDRAPLCPPATTLLPTPKRPARRMPGDRASPRLAAPTP